MIQATQSTRNRRSFRGRKFTLAERASEVLHYIWSPINVVAYPQCRDEYDRYLPAVMALLESGSSIQKIANHLDKVARTRIHTFHMPSAMNAAIALVAWREELDAPRKI